MNISSFLRGRSFEGAQCAVRFLMLNCRRCKSEALLELTRLKGADHLVYRCRDCGFLFSPPEVEGLTPAVGPSVPAEEAQRQVERVAAIRRRPSAGR